MREAEPPSLDDLARRYLDLWQEQWAALCSDPTMADSVARTMQAVSQSALMLNPFLSMPPGFGGGKGERNPWADMMAGLWPNGTAETKAEASKGGTGARQPGNGERAPAAGAAPAGPASGDGADDLAELGGRIAALEQQLAALASQPAPTGGGTDGADRPAARKKPGPRRSPRAKPTA
ncbi:hypothetical protein [Niveispirillum sp. BGYR6]|uniref:hypothetical protein n=1 Tax=Niveispirillum sp. BGYR6 TaxID=2971249 RepID=UPI0022B96524|nr:hypothetical protein [Niveispirillum sp. BGYR6]MDG5494666.1 hypothetical protein [Niveispirillum sp. BGYR6]